MSDQLSAVWFFACLLSPAGMGQGTAVEKAMAGTAMAGTMKGKRGADEEGERRAWALQIGSCADGAADLQGTVTPFRLEHRPEHMLFAYYKLRQGKE